MVSYRLALDGTDSSEGGCTTWTASLLIDYLKNSIDDIRFTDYPWLLRLNPNIPHKTRGNGVVLLNFSTDISLKELSELILPFFKHHAHLYRDDNKAAFGIASNFSCDCDFFKRALQSYIKEVEDHDDIWFYPRTSPSTVGVIAAIHATLDVDYTFELLSYRKKENFGSPREINEEALVNASRKYTTTFSSYDFDQGRELICPAGPDPVFAGIRGDDAGELINFFNSLQIEEEQESVTIFRSNQATNQHVMRPTSKIEKHHVISTFFTVTSGPIELEGGHVKMEGYLNREVGESIVLLVYEPTKSLRNRARELLPGDMMYIHANVADHLGELQLHLEYMRIMRLVPALRFSSPICECGKRMTKAGKFSGYKCKECGRKRPTPNIERIPRRLFPNQQIYASKSAQRHLTRPIERVMVRNTGEICDISSEQFRFILTDNQISTDFLE